MSVFSVPAFPVGDSLAAALAAARGALVGGAASAEVCLGPGTYNLSEPIELSPADSGLVLRAGDPDDPPVLTSRIELGERARLDDVDLPVSPQARGRLWRIALPPGHDPAALFADGRRQMRATWPKGDDWETWPACVAGEGECDLAIPPEQQRRHTCLADIRINMLSSPYTHWINYIARVEAVEGSRVTVARAISPNPYLPPAPSIPFRIENALESLAEPDEWCADTAAGCICWWPPEGMDPAGAALSVPGLATLIRIAGAEAAPVRGVVLRGLYLTGTDAGGAAVELAHASECLIENCTLDDLGAIAVRAATGVFCLRVADCRIAHCGGVGIMLVAPRCTGRVLNGHNVLERNELHHCGEVDWHGVGINIGGSNHNVVRDNDLHDLPYGAVLVGGTRLIMPLTGKVANWPPEAVPLGRIQDERLNIDEFKRYVCGYNLIEGNRVTDVMRQLDDGGAIYCHASHDNIVRRNVVKRSHRGCTFGLYFDDDEVRSIMEENVVIDCPVGEGHGSSIHVHDNARNVVRRNVIIGSPCPFTFPRSYGGHRVSENVFILKPAGRAPLPPERNNGRYAETAWDAGENYFDHNVYWSEDGGARARAVLAQMRQLGYDAHSRVAEPEGQGGSPST